MYQTTLPALDLLIGEIVIYHDPEYGKMPAIVLEAHHDKTLSLCGFGITGSKYIGDHIVHGTELGQWDIRPSDRYR